MPPLPKKILVSLSILFIPFLLFLIDPNIVSSEEILVRPTSLSGKICPEPPSNLISRWSGDWILGRSESERNIAADAKATNNGKILGGVSIRPWETGNNFHLNGSDGYIRMENSKSLNFGTSPFSLEVWFRLGLRGRGYSPGNIIRKSNYPAKGPGYGYWLKAGGNDRVLEFFAGETVGISGERRGRITTTIKTDTWYYAVATRDDSGAMKLYVNGELKGTAEAPGANTTSDAPFTLGAWDRGGATEPFFGVIGGVSVYNKALSQSEILSIFNIGNDSRCQSITGSQSRTSKPVIVAEPSALEITYPVKELGNCVNQQECRAYCGVAANNTKCITYAQKNGLEVEIPDDKKAVFTAMQKGESPGQCKDELSCRAYCEDIDHLDECVSFVEKFKLASGDELKEMRKMATVKKSGVAFPGNCKTKESCLKYCDNSANAVVCMEFALKAGFIPKEDAESVGKILPYLKSGGKLPGGCTTKESCDAYCGSEANTNVCMDFAVGAGFMTKEEGEILKKTGGKGPGNCRSKEACENYCKDEKHIDECVDFAVKAGFISKEEAEQAKRYKITSGPGGCKSKADCEAFCVVNQDVCFQFAKDHGMLSEEDLKNIEEQKKFLGSLDQAPPEWLACMEKELGSEFFKRFKTGKITQAEAKSPALETAQRKCESEIGQDIRKELEACLGKPTCAEFNSCFDALPKPKGNQQQGGQQSSGQGPQDENGKKVEARVRACLDEKMDACLGLSCSEFLACTKSLQQGGDQQGGQQGTGGQGQQQGQGENVKFNAKMKACQEELKVSKTKEIQAKMDACLTRSCSEFDACIKSVQGGGEQGTGDQSGQQQEQGQGAPDPKITAKAKACQQEKVSACLSKPCGEFQACLNALGGGGDSGGEQQGGTPDPAVQTKFMTCFPPPPQGEGGGGGQYPLLLRYPTFATILNFILGR